MVDHLVYGARSLEEGIESLERLLGVRAVPGGKHQGRGTHNALLSLSDRSYLEIIARDPDQQPPAGGLSFGVDRIARPKLVGWAIRSEDIDGLVTAARAAGYDPGDVESMDRMRPDGLRLCWQLTPSSADPAIPFVIDWSDTPHPSMSAPSGVALRSLFIEHPKPAEIQSILKAMNVDVPVKAGVEPALIAELTVPMGSVELR